MSYIINVALRGSYAGSGKPPKHVFRTAPDSITNKTDALAIAIQLQKSFPPQDYDIEIHRQVTSYEPVL